MTEKYYYADGQKIPLVVSERFVAVRSAGERRTGQESLSSIAERFSGTMSPAQVFEVPEYDLALIAMPANGGPKGKAESMRSALSESRIPAGPEVFESPDGDPNQVMIPVGEIIVKFKASANAETRRKLMDKHKLEVRQEDYPEPGAYLVATNKDALEVANALQESDGVEFAQPNFVHLGTRLTVMEPNFSGANADFMAGLLADPGFTSQWNLQRIRAPQAWEISKGNPSIAVAVVDEGCDMTHEDLSYKGGYDAYAGDPNPQPSGNDAHGTACAGVVAMAQDNGKGGVGVAPGCKIVGIRIARGTGGGFWDTTDAKVADGVRKAVDAPLRADVLSNSYRVGPSSVVTNAFIHAQTNGRGGKGCPVAVAAGNFRAPETPANRVVTYPATLSPTIPGLMAVSATNEWDQLKSPTSLDGENWWGSCYGPQVDVAAPGVHIYTSDISGGAGYGPGNYVNNFNGTSSATPHVAGLMALILSVDPDLRSWEVEDIIKLTADDLGAAGRDERFGFGRINARRALEAASRIWYAISVVPVFLGAGRECYMRASVRMYNPGINTVRLDGLTLTSHNPTWSAEVDRFEYRPNPGNVMAPRSGQDVRFNSVLLKANGNQAAWSYNWALNWNYTFWRPGSPGFPLSEAVVLEAPGVGAVSSLIRGSAEGQGASDAQNEPGGNGHGQRQPNGVSMGDSVTVDREARTITIVVK